MVVLVYMVVLKGGDDHELESQRRMLDESFAIKFVWKNEKIKEKRPAMAHLKMSKCKTVFLDA